MGPHPRIRGAVDGVLLAIEDWGAHMRFSDAAIADLSEQTAQ